MREIQRASGRQGKVQRGMKSELGQGFAATDIIGVWNNWAREDESYRNKEAHNVRFPHDYESEPSTLSGEVRTYHISELPVEERERLKIVKALSKPLAEDE